MHTNKLSFPYLFRTIITPKNEVLIERRHNQLNENFHSSRITSTENHIVKILNIPGTDETTT